MKEEIAIIKIGNEMTEIPASDLDKDGLDVTFGGSLMIRLEKENGVLKPVNGVDGWGRNCKDFILEQTFGIYRLSTSPADNRGKEEYWIKTEDKTPDYYKSVCIKLIDGTVLQNWSLVSNGNYCYFISLENDLVHLLKDVKEWCISTPPVAEKEQEIDIKEWDWLGWLQARIPELKKSQNVFWLKQCVNDLLETEHASIYKKQVKELQSKLYTERSRNNKLSKIYTPTSQPSYET